MYRKRKRGKTVYNFADIITIIVLILNLLFKMACVLVLFWTIVSLVDVSIHNLTLGYTYSNWNLFEVISHING